MITYFSGVYSDDWGVSYSSTNICALKGSSVIMSCTYKYPPGYKIKKVFWTKTDVKEQDEEFPDLFNDPEYSQRIQYLGDKQQNCTIRLNDVTQKDSHKYYFRFITNITDGSWIGRPGVTLKITGNIFHNSVLIVFIWVYDLHLRSIIFWERNLHPQYIQMSSVVVVRSSCGVS